MAFADLNDEQLIHRVLEIERELVRAQFKHSMNQLENTSRLRVLRKQIAQLRTEARVRETAGGLNKNELVVRHRRTFSNKLSTAAPGAAPAAQPAERGGFLSGIVDKLTGKE